MSHLYSRTCLNITKKERILRRAFNRNRWSRVPPNRIKRMIDLLQDIERCQRDNETYDHLIDQGNLSPGFERQKYPTLEYTNSEYESDSPDDEEVSSNESTKSQYHSPKSESENEEDQNNQEPEIPQASSSVRVLSNSPIAGFPQASTSSPSRQSM